MSQRIQLRRGTSEEWSLADPVLLPGEQGYETDSSRLKVGDGVTRWSSLPYIASDAISVAWSNIDGKPESFAPDTSDSAFQSYVSAQVASHSASAQGVHGISDTSLLVYDSDSRLTDARQPLSHSHTLADVSASGATLGETISWDGAAWSPSPLPDVSLYLPLSGGTMTGDIAWGTGAVAGDASTANTFAVSTGGIERMRVSKNGMTIPDNYQNETVGVYGIYSAINKSATNAGGTFAFLAGGDAPSQFNGQILVSSVGAATPSIANRSDPTTGFDIQPGIVSVSTGGTERLRVGSLGNFGIDTAPQASVAFGIDYSWTEIGSGGVIVHSSKGTPPTTCTEIQMYRAEPNIQSTGATTYGFNVAPATVTGSGTITTQIGFHCNDLAIGSTAHGFRGRVNKSSGNARYNLYMDGTAPNYLGGQTQLGSTQGQALSWLPSLSFLYDTDTGIGRIASNTVSVFCGGDEVGRWRADGGLSVGSNGGSSNASTAHAIGVVREETVNNSVSVGVRSKLSSSVATTYGFYDHAQIPSSTTIGYRASFAAVGPDLADSSSSVGTYRCFVATNADTTVASQSGFYSNLNVVAGSTRLAVHAAGSAPSEFAGQVRIAAGSASSPSVAFSADLDTGVFSPAANHISFAAAGSEVLRVTSDYVSTSGVGLALNVPSYPLPINMADVGVYTNVNPVLGGSNRHNFYAGGSSPNYFEGDIGIGTTSPTSPLDVNGNSIRLRVSSPPSSSTASGNQGEIRWDANYLYVCVAANTWRRAAITTW